MNAPVKTPAIGDNRRPLITADQLAKDFAHVEAFVAGAENEAKDVPPHVEDDEDLAAVNAMVVKLRAAAKRCDELRDQEKRPYLDAGNVVQGTFKAWENRLLTLKTSIEARGTRYLDKKRAAEQRRREEIECAARAQAEQARLAAIEAAKQAAPAQAQAAIAAAAEAQARADDAAAASHAKPAELARTRTSAGVVTLLEHYEPRVEDFLQIDLKPIQEFLREDEVMAALRAYARKYRDELKAGRAKIDGVTFVLTTKGSFR